MNTPEKSQIGTSLSKFEDSPVFSYLSNLSPIKPVKSAPITQTFNSLNFSSLPSIFTSPHVILQKESRFLRRHNTPSESQSESAYIDASSNKENAVFADVNQLRNHVTDFHPESGEPGPEPLNAESDYQETSISRIALQKSPCGWESLFSDGADLLMLDSPNITKDLNALFKSPPVVNVDSSLASQFQQDNPCFQTEVFRAETEEMDCTHNDFPTMIECLTSNPNENADDELMACSHRSLHRRCLVFDANAAHRKNLLGASSSNSSKFMQSDQNAASTIRKPVTSKSSSSSSLRVLSGIGLHLNNLTTSGDNGLHVSLASSTASFQSPSTATESLRDVFYRTSFDNIARSGSAQGSDDAVLGPRLMSVDDFDQDSLKKKRQKPENSGNESCKRCNCKKSKCLKLYCECFAAGVYCNGTCTCQDCYNKPIHEETVMETRKQIESRNPLAFAPKVIRTADTLPVINDEIMNTPASARHKRGCNCKKSSCQKKYCECFQGGVGCSVNCRCETCKNVFGTKDGSVPATSLDDDNEEEIEKGSRNIMRHKIEEHNNISTFQDTPLRKQFSSKGKPPRSTSFITVGYASGLNAGYKSGEPNHLDSELEMLGHSGSNAGVVKTSSPNSKRISPRNSNFESSFGGRSTRKLILQSIPSFPSLTQP